MKNVFVAMCKFSNNVDQMTHDNCNLFKRSYTDKGIGFTFNNEREDKLIKTDFRRTELSPNTNRKPSIMKSAASEHALTVVIENNAEEVNRYFNDPNNTKLEPIEVTISLHNPVEPANMRSRSFNIPLGHSTKVYLLRRQEKLMKTGCY